MQKVLVFKNSVFNAFGVIFNKESSSTYNIGNNITLNIITGAATLLFKPNDGLTNFKNAYFTLSSSCNNSTIGVCTSASSGYPTGVVRQVSTTGANSTFDLDISDIETDNYYLYIFGHTGVITVSEISLGK